MITHHDFIFFSVIMVQKNDEQMVFTGNFGYTQIIFSFVLRIPLPLMEKMFVGSRLRHFPISPKLFLKGGMEAVYKYAKHYDIPLKKNQSRGELCAILRSFSVKMIDFILYPRLYYVFNRYDRADIY